MVITHAPTSTLLDNSRQLRQPKLLAHILKQKAGAYLAFLPQSLKLNVTKGVCRKLLGMFLVVPFLVLVDLGAFNVLALGIATLACVLPESVMFGGSNRFPST